MKYFVVVYNERAKKYREIELVFLHHFMSFCLLYVPTDKGKEKFCGIFFSTFSKKRECILHHNLQSQERFQSYVR